MKIIAGERRGHKFEGPKTRKIRPASDLIREAIFNILRGEVEDRLVLDLYAGTGALGLEALSRGARRVIFVERDRDHVTLIKRNMATLRYEDRATAVSSDVLRWVHSFQAPEGEPIIAFLDPPYRDYEDQASRMYRMLGELLAKDATRLDDDHRVSKAARPEPAPRARLVGGQKVWQHHALNRPDSRRAGSEG